MKSEARNVGAGARGVLVCFALEEEAGPFRKLAAGRAGVSVLITGMGRENAEDALRSSFQTWSPRLLLTCGFAGALNPALSLGEVVFETDDESCRSKLQGAGARPARFHCAARVAVTAVEKAELRRSTGADAVDMESEAIQSLCRERGIPCATVRAISDAANDDLPLDFNQLSKPNLSLDYGKLALALAKSPGKIPALRRLQKNCQLAAVKLAEILATLL